MRVEGKHALLIGAATGIGRASALLLADQGADLVISDINAEDGQHTAEQAKKSGRTAVFMQVDAGDEAQVERVVHDTAEHLGGLDVLVYFAGVQRAGRIEQFPTADFDLVMRVNLAGMYFAIKYAVPHLRDSGGGSIVNIASVAGIKGGPGLTVYSASKGAVIAFTKALGAELAPDGIRVNTICPGWIDTPFNQAAIDFMGGRDEQEDLIKHIVPMRRQGREEEIAPAVVFLASDESSYMTGHAIVIDGGMT
jgi:NAD(P)-dependent dehydrogenase (short-subunit alcohol dehydrogenase family)